MDIVSAQAQVRDHQGLQESLLNIIKKLSTQNDQETKRNELWKTQGDLVILAITLFNLGDRKHSQTVLKEAMKIQKIHTPWRTMISVLLAKLGQGNLAIRLFNEQKPETSFQQFSQVQDLCRLAEGLRVGNNIEESKQILGKASSLLNHLRHKKIEYREEGTDKVANWEDTPYFSHTGLLPIGILQAHLGEFAAAEQTLSKIHQDFQGRILYAMFQTQLKMGETEKSRKTIARMKFPSTDTLKLQIKFGDIRGAKLTMEQFLLEYSNHQGLKEYKQSMQITEEHPEYHQNLRMIGAVRTQGEELGSLLKWATSQPSKDLKAFALLGIVEGLVSIDNTLCCIGYPYDGYPINRM